MKHGFSQMNPICAPSVQICGSCFHASEIPNPKSKNTPMKTSLSLVFSLLLAATLSAAAPSKPNILFIFGDDCGIDSFGCYGSDRAKTFTPNIDALAQSGVRFERAYSTPLCGPSRCLIMTGRYGFRTGGLTNQTAGNPSFKDEPSLARILKQAG